MILTALFVFTNLLLFAVVAALLRQLNRERSERSEMMERYRELALAVRRVHLRTEAPDVTMDDIMGMTRPTGSTVTDEEGSDS